MATELAKLLAESGSVVETLTVISPHRMPCDIEDVLLMEYAFVQVLGINPGALGLPAEDDVAGAMRAVLARTPGRIADGAIAALDGEFAPVAEAFRRFGHRPLPGRLATVVTALPAGGFPADQDYLETLYDVFVRNIRAITRYSAGPYAGDVTLIQACESNHLLPTE